MSRDSLKEVQISLVINKSCRLIPQEYEVITLKEILGVEDMGEILEVALKETFKAKIN